MGRDCFRLALLALGFVVFFSAAASGAPPSELPPSMEFLDAEICGEKGYLLSVEPAEAFAVHVALEICSMRFLQPKGEEFVVPVVAGAGNAMPGAPHIPVVRFYLAGPPGSSLTVRELRADTWTMPGIDVGPSPTDHSESEEEADIFLTNPGLYSRPFPAKPVAVAHSVTHRRAVELHLVEASLGSYDGASGDLDVHYRLEFTVDAEGGRVGHSVWNDNVSGDWGRFYRDLVVNPWDLVRTASAQTNESLRREVIPPGPDSPEAPGPLPGDWTADWAPGCKDYLVIAADHLQDDAASLAFDDSDLFLQLEGRFGEGNVVVKTMSGVKSDLETARAQDNNDIPANHTPGYGPDDLRIWIRRCDPLPKYLLLVGDARDEVGQNLTPNDGTRVPTSRSTRVIKQPLSDEYYCTDLDASDGDTGKTCSADAQCAPGHYCDSEGAVCRLDHRPGMPEIFCARIPAQDLTDLRTASGNIDLQEVEVEDVVGKLTEYHERDGGAVGNRRVCSSFGESSFAQNGRRNDLYLSGYGGAIIEETSAPLNEDREQLRDCLNEGPLLATYHGHGGPSLLSALGFDTGWFANAEGWTDVCSQGTSDVLPTFLSISCSTADLRIANRSLGETLITAPDRGAAMYLGATVVSPHFHNATFYDAFMSNVFRFDSETGKSYSMGQLLALAKARVVLQWGMDDNWTLLVLDEYVLLGEASARIPLKNNDLVGYWRFDDTNGPWLDHSDYGRDAKDPGMDLNPPEPLTGFMDNGRTGGRNCDGEAGCYVAVPAFTKDFGQSLTLNAWLKWDSLLAGGLIEGGEHLKATFDKKLVGGVYKQTVLLTLPGCSQTELVLETAPGGWSMLTLVWDGSSNYVKAYVDGAEVTSETGCVDSLSLASQLLKVGEALSGAFDELRIYDTALSPADVTRIYQMDVLYFKQDVAVDVSFDFEFPPAGSDVPGMSPPSYLDAGPGLGGLSLVPGSNYMHTEGVRNEAIFLEGPDRFVFTGTQSPAVGSDGCGATMWLRPRLRPDDETHGSILSKPGGADLFIDYADHKYCLNEVQYCVGDPGKESVYNIVPYDRWTALGISIDTQAGTVTWYLDGIAVPGVFPPGLQCGELDNLVLGDGYEGEIDELRVYSRPLTFADIAHDSHRQGINVSFDFEQLSARLSDADDLVKMFDLSGFENTATLSDVDLCNASAGPDETMYCAGDDPLVRTSARFGEDDTAHLEFHDSMDDSIEGYAVSVWFNVGDISGAIASRTIWEKGDWMSLSFDPGTTDEKTDDKLTFVVGGSTTSLDFDGAGGWAHAVVSVSSHTKGCSATAWLGKRSDSSPTEHALSCTDHAWTTEGWNLGGKTAADEFVGQMDEFALSYVPLTAGYVKDALFDHPAHYSWAAAEYSMDGDFDGLTLDVTPYGNVARLLEGVGEVNGTVVASSNMWKPSYDHSCPRSGQCMRFSGQREWLERNVNLTDFPFSEEAHGNANGDVGMCFWQHADADVAALSTASGKRQNRQISLGAVDDAFVVTQRLLHEEGTKDSARFSSSNLEARWGSGELLELRDMPGFGEWKRLCVFVSRLTGMASWFVDGVLTRTDAAWEPPMVSANAVVRVGSDETGNSGYRGNMGGVSFYSHSVGGGKQFLEAGANLLRSYYRLDGHLGNSWPSRRPLTNGQGSFGQDAFKFTDSGYIGKGVDLDGSGTLLAPRASTPAVPPSTSVWLGTAFKTTTSTSQDLLGIGRTDDHDLSVSLADGNKVNVSVHGQSSVTLDIPAGAAGYADGEWHGLGLEILGTNEAGGGNGACDRYRIRLFYDGLPCTGGTCQQVVETACDAFDKPLVVGTTPDADGCSEPGSTCFVGTVDEFFASDLPMDESQVRFMFHRALGVWPMDGLGQASLDPFRVPSLLGASGADGYLSSGLTCGGEETLCDPSWLFDCGVGESPANTDGSHCLRLGLPTSEQGNFSERVDFSFTRNSFVDEAEREFTLAAWVYLVDAEADEAGNVLFASGRSTEQEHAVSLTLGWDHVRFFLNARGYSVPYHVPRFQWVHVAVSVEPKCGGARLRFASEGQSSESFQETIATGPNLAEGDLGTGYG